MQPTRTGDPLEMQPTYNDLGSLPVRQPTGNYLGSLPVPLEMSRGDGDGGGVGGGLGLGHMKAALKRQMEADQAAAVGADHSLAEAVEAAQAQESLETTAPPRFRRLSSAARLVQQGEWGEISQHSAAATKKGLMSVIREARDRHSVLQVAAPHELDKHGRDVDDPFRLRDMQTCQVRRLLTCTPLAPHYSLLLLTTSNYSLLLLTTPCYSPLITHHSPLPTPHHSPLTPHHIYICIYI